MVENIARVPSTPSKRKNKAPEYFKVKLPCKGYIKKYVTRLFGTPGLPNEPIWVTENNVLGNIITLSLSKNTYESRQFGHAYTYAGLDNEMVLWVNKWQFINLGFDVSKDKVIIINRILENLFQQDIYTSCYSFCLRNNNANLRNQGRKEAIELFVKMYDIELEYDITYEALKKMEYRHRMKIEKLILQKANNVDAIVLSTG